MPPESSNKPETPQTPQTPSTPPTPPEQPPMVGGQYKKHNLWLMVLLYIVLGAVIYGVIYWFYLR